ncbi:MAG: DUF1788 domain-containing protein [Spirochaetales bacterium]|jgi:hypothetical protein|nr:DUF1788 domain-containing protein [Spirochaetales bacterium]
MINADINNTAQVQDEIEKLISSDAFISMAFAGAEIPNYILPYPAEKQAEYNRMAQNLKEKLILKGIRTININMYDEEISILQSNGSGTLDDYLQADDLSKDDLFEDFSNILDINSVFAPHIADLIDGSGAKMVFFSGLGEAYPFIRMHSLLESLPVYMRTRKPIVVFYPGSYDKETGNSCFRLFGRLKPVNYYRAFNIFTEVN